TAAGSPPGPTSSPSRASASATTSASRSSADGPSIADGPGAPLPSGGGAPRFVRGPRCRWATSGKHEGGRGRTLPRLSPPARARLVKSADSRRRPILCNHYVTSRCNAACGFCNIWQQPSPLIREADVARNLDDLRRLGVRIIDFTGGEPLLHPQMDRLLAMAKDRGFLTTLTTNGLLYPKRAERLRGLVDLLHFSIDAPVPEEHDASRGVRCFDKLMESIEV